MKFPQLAAIAAAMTLLHPAAAVAVDDDNGAWGIFSTGDRILRGGQPTRWRYAFDAQWRHFNRGNGSNQYVLRPAVGYDLAPGMSVWAGYGYFVTDPDNGSNVREHRWWQQFSWSALSWDWGSLSLRTRLEERDRESSSDISWRLRQQVQLAVPVPAYDVTVIASVEPYVNFRDTDWGARSGFDQLRSYIGVRMPITDRMSLEAGYMHQLINRSAIENAANHLALLHLRKRF